MSYVKKFVNVIPGFVIALGIAVIAKLLESLLPIHLIGASVIAMFIGMVINAFHQPGNMMAPGIKFKIGRAHV